MKLTRFNSVDDTIHFTNAFLMEHDNKVWLFIRDEEIFVYNRTTREMTITSTEKSSGRSQHLAGAFKVLGLNCTTDLFYRSSAIEFDANGDAAFIVGVPSAE